MDIDQVLLVQLPIRCRRKEDESDDGYFFRACELNGIDGIAAASWRRSLTNAKDVTRPRQRTRVWNYYHPRFCALCWGLSNTWRREWELTVLTVCPFHEVRLLSVCPRCGSPLRWGRPKFSECECGEAIEDWPSVESTTEEHIVSVAVWQTFQGQTAETLFADGPLENRVICRLVMLLGAHTIKRRALRPQSEFPYDNAGEMQKHCAAAGKYFADWPSSLYAEFKRRREMLDSACRQSAHPMSQFETAFLKLAKCDPTGYLLTVWDGFLADLGSYAVAMNRPVDFLIRKLSPLTTATWAAKALHMRRTRVIELVRDGVVAGEIVPHGTSREICFVDWQSLRAHKHERECLVNTRDAARYLGVTRRFLYRLLAAGLVRRTRVDQSSVAMFNSSELAEFMSSISSSYGSVYRHKPFYMHVGKFLRSVGGHDEIISLMQGAIINKKRCFLSPERGARLCEMYVDMRAVEAERQRKVTGGGLISIPDAAKELSIKQELLYLLVREGYFPVAEHRVGARTQHWVESEKLMQFRQDFVSVSKFARSAHAETASVRSYIEKIGLQPAIDVTYNKRRLTLFKRADLMKVFVTSTESRSAMCRRDP